MTLTKKQATIPGRTKLARAVKLLSPSERFFYLNAGYSYNPKTEKPEQGRIRCALELAKAEEQARGLGWEFEWDWDQDPDLSWMDAEERAKDHEVLCCRVYDPAEETGKGHFCSLASLCGITDPDQNYRRVIEAELASEALAEYDRETERLDAH